MPEGSGDGESCHRADDFESVVSSAVVMSASGDGGGGYAMEHKGHEPPQWQ
jgi:hypothetical protein